MLRLEDKVLERSLRLGIELSQEEISKAVMDLKRWTRKEYASTCVIKTYDGSYTLASGLYGEPYHSVSAGAITEAVEKFVRPSGVVELAGKLKKITLMDVGFGLGYNTAIAVFLIKKENPKAFVEVHAFEKSLPENFIYLPEPFGDMHRVIINLLPEGERGGVYVKLHEGDIRSCLPKTRLKADAVFHDAFSPYKNPEVWSLDLLGLMRERIKRKGVWVSYTSSLPVRKALKDLGFKVGETRAVGRRRGGTIASMGRDFVLPPAQEEKLETSPFSVPFRDEGLKEDPLNILIDYRINVLLREREFSLAR